MNGLLALILVWIGSLLVGRPLRRSFTMARHWRWRQLFAGFVLYAIGLSAILAFEIQAGMIEPAMPVLNLTENAAQIAVFAVVAFVGLILAAGAEELAFRGWLLRDSAALTRVTWIYLLVNGLLFSLIHLDPDPNAFIARAAMGVGFCWMALRLGGIEFATGAHAANNFLLVLFIEPFSLDIPDPEPFQVGYLAETAIMLAIMVIVTEFAVRHESTRALIGGPAGEDETRTPEIFD